jgi:hypothetical protein
MGDLFLSLILHEIFQKPKCSKGMGTAKTLTEEQFRALEDYAKEVGPDWKKRLNFDWLRAGTNVYGFRDRYCYLHQVRNRFGPQWLAKFEFEDFADQFES